MSEVDNTEEKKPGFIEPWKASVPLFLIYLSAPYALQISNFDKNEFTFMALFWAYLWNSIGPYGDPLWIGPFFLTSIPYTIFRLVFIVMIYRLYNEKTSKLRTFLTGIVGELQYPIIYLVGFFPQYRVWLEEGHFLFLLPIPFLLLVGIAIVRFFPPPKTEIWKNKTADDSWWEQSYMYEEESH